MRLKDELGSLLDELLASDSAQLALEMNEPAEYGNEELVFKGTRFQFRVVRDRGQIFIDVAPSFEDGEWFMLPRLFEYLGLGQEGEFSPENYGPTTPQLLRKQVEVFCANVAQIAALLSPENYPAARDELKAFWRRKAREVFGAKAFLPPAGES